MACEDESQECKRARRDYDDAESERASLKGAIEDLKDIRAGYAGAAGLGAIILAGAVVVSGVRAVCDCRSIQHWA